VVNSARKHRRFRAEASSRKPFARARLAIALLALIAFTVQSYLVQTHIHNLPAAIAAIGDGAGQSVSSPQKGGQLPAQSDETKCPLCQDSLRAGTYLIPAVIIVLPPINVIAAPIVIVAQALANKSVSYIWRSRGPPHA
jgi:hypothetical protein